MSWGWDDYVACSDDGSLPVTLDGFIDWELFQRCVQRWVVRGSGLPTNKVLWSDPKAMRPAADGIVLRIMKISTVGNTFRSIEDNALEFGDLTVASVDAGANTFTFAAAHGLTNGDGPVRLSSTLTVPGGTEEGVDYWVIYVSPTVIKLASSFRRTGGTYVDDAPSGNDVEPVDLSSTGSGVLTISGTDETMRAGEEILHVLAGQVRVIVNIECHSAEATKNDMAAAILQRVSARANLPGQLEILEKAGAGIIEIEDVVSVRGRSDAIMFEPRAVMDVLFSIVTRQTESGTIIHSVAVEPTINDDIQDEQIWAIDGGPDPVE